MIHFMRKTRFDNYIYGPKYQQMYKSKSGNRPYLALHRKILSWTMSYYHVLYWELWIKNKNMPTRGVSWEGGFGGLGRPRSLKGRQKKKKKKERERKRGKEKKKESDKSTWRTGRHSSTSRGAPEGAPGNGGCRNSLFQYGNRWYCRWRPLTA